MFVMPLQCQAVGGVIPPVGSRVSYVVIIDPKTARPRAENVQLYEDPVEPQVDAGQVDDMGLDTEQLATLMMAMEAEAQAQAHVQAQAQTSGSDGLRSGTIKKNEGKHGFIQQDSGEKDMFVMPLQCQALGGEIPPIGCRVSYNVVMDPKSGRPPGRERPSRGNALERHRRLDD